MTNFASNEMRRLAAIYRDRARHEPHKGQDWLQSAEHMETQAHLIDRKAEQSPAPAVAIRLGLARPR